MLPKLFLRGRLAGTVAVIVVLAVIAVNVLAYREMSRPVGADGITRLRTIATYTTLWSLLLVIGLPIAIYAFGHASESPAQSSTSAIVDRAERTSPDGSDDTLRAAQERLERVIGSSNAVLYELRVTGTSVRLDWISHNVTRILGYAMDEIYAPGWWLDNIHPEDRERMRDNCDPANHRDGAQEYRLRHSDGQYRWLRDERRYLASLEGEDAQVVGAWFDITEQRRIDERLRHIQKMEALGTLASGVAHDFNNTLTVVSAYGQLLLIALHDQPSLWPDVEEIVKAAERGTALTQQLLAFSRNRAAEQSVVALNTVIHDTQSMLTRLIGAKIELIVRLDPAVPDVMADVGQLTQVLMNLVVNARDAMPNGGKLVIETSVAVDSFASDPLAQAVRYSVVTVTDTGIGMDGETQARIFEPFFTTKGEGFGTGLGLSTVFGIVKQAGGSVSVSSEPGRGASFTVMLPALENAADS